jgi:enamine deaminase RidA (YjgF/YER057c/UK114 family)
MSDVILPRGWPRPRGYAHGVRASGSLLAVAGQVGAKPAGGPMPRGFVDQFARALDNVIAVVEAAGGEPGDLVSLTLFVTDLRQYRAHTEEIGRAWRERFGGHFPAMALVEVKALLDPEALVEVQGLAVLP